MNKNKSFTLIELLVVIVIIGILAGVIIISTASSITKANITKLKSFDDSVKNSMLLNLVSEWELDKINGVTTPDAWGSNTGTIGDGVTATTYPTLKTKDACVSDGCMSFDGGDYVNLGNSSTIKPTDTITVSIWLNPASVKDGNIHDAIDTHLGYEIQERNTGYWTWYVHLEVSEWSEIHTVSNTAIANKWQHVVGTYNSSTGSQKIYLDGDLKTSVVISGNQKILYSTDNNVMIGDVNYHGRYFNGLIDDVRVYDTELSFAEIRRDYVAGLKSLYTKGLISKVDFNKSLARL